MERAGALRALAMPTDLLPPRLRATDAADNATAPQVRCPYCRTVVVRAFTVPPDQRFKCPGCPRYLRLDERV